MKDKEILEMVAKIEAEADRMRLAKLTEKFGHERAEKLMLERSGGCTRVVLDGEEDEHDEIFAFSCDGGFRVGGH